MEQIPFGTDDFAENPEPRVPCLLLLDLSSSMNGKPIAELNNGLITFKDELSADSLAAKRVEVGIVSFGQEVKIECEFTTANAFQPPQFTVSGMTPMGEAVQRGLDLLENRKQQYKANGIAYYRPWAFLISDGAPNDEGWQSAASRSKESDAKGTIALFAVGVEGANVEVLSLFTNREVLRLVDLRFRDLFLWLSSSLKSVSQSTPGDKVVLEAPTGWATV